MVGKQIPYHTTYLIRQVSCSSDGAQPSKPAEQNNHCLHLYSHQEEHFNSNTCPYLQQGWASLSEDHFCFLRITVAPDGTLWIRNVSRADEGKYTCFAENYLGKANSTGHLSVRGKVITRINILTKYSATYSLTKWANPSYPSIQIMVKSQIRKSLKKHFRSLL